MLKKIVAAVLVAVVASSLAAVPVVAQTSGETPCLIFVDTLVEDQEAILQALQDLGYSVEACDTTEDGSLPSTNDDTLGTFDDDAIIDEAGGDTSNDEGNDTFEDDEE